MWRSPMERWDIEPPPYLQTPHFPPSFAQCLQYLQFLQAWQGSEPVQVDEKEARGKRAAPSRKDKRIVATEFRNCFVPLIAIPPVFKIYPTVLCSTGTILRRKGNGKESKIE